MSGMKALGRVYNIVAAASGKPINISQCSGIGFLAVAATTATASLSFQCSTAYSGGTTTDLTPGNGFGQPATWYKQTAGDGTGAWSAQTASWTTKVLTIGATAGNVSYVDFLVSELADTYDYIVCTATNASLVAILYDLNVQRTPANLLIVGS